jgi:membrane protease subunit HflC
VSGSGHLPSGDRRRPRRLAWVLLALGAALALYAGQQSLFALDVTEYGVITRFGRVIQVVEAPGLHVKAPVDRVVRLDKRLLSTTPAAAEYLTADKKNVVIRSLVTWRIADPQRFLETLDTRVGAELRLADVVLAEVGSVLGAHTFASFISSQGQESRFASMVATIRQDVERLALPAYGIEVVDVDIRHLSLPEQNQQSVFERMKAERGRMAKQYRSEGERDAKETVAHAEREKTRLLAEAHKEAERVRAEGEAEAMRIYADAFTQDPGFYRFVRTLQAYDRFVDERTLLFLPADAEVLELLQEAGQPAARLPGPPAPPGQVSDGLALDEPALRLFGAGIEAAPEAGR